MKQKFLSQKLGKLESFLFYYIIIIKKSLMWQWEHPARASYKRIHSEKPGIILLNGHYRKMHIL